MLTREKYLEKKLILDRQTILNSGLTIGDNQKVTDNNTFFLQKELTAVEAQMIEHFPTDTTHRKMWKVVNLGPGLKSIDYHEIMRTGRSEYVAYGETDIPSATAKRNAVPNPVRKSKIKYSFEIEDVDYMKRSGQRLDDQDAKAAKEGNEYTLNNTAWFGRSDLGLKGYFSHAVDGNLAVVSPVSGASSGADNTWATKLPEEILDDVKRLKVAGRTNTSGAIDYNVLGVGTEGYSLLQFTYFNTVTGETVLDRILNKKIFDRVEMCSELDTVTVSGLVTAQNVAVAFSDRTDVFKRHIPVELVAIPIQVQGFTLTVYLHSDDAGLFLYRKYGGAYLLDI